MSPDSFVLMRSCRIITGYEEIIYKLVFQETYLVLKTLLAFLH